MDNTRETSEREETDMMDIDKNSHWPVRDILINFQAVVAHKHVPNMWRDDGVKYWQIARIVSAEIREMQVFNGRMAERLTRRS